MDESGFVRAARGADEAPHKIPTRCFFSAPLPRSREDYKTGTSGPKSREAEHHVAARCGAAGFEEAQVALGNFRGAGERQLRLAAVGAPPTQARAEGGGCGHEREVIRSVGKRQLRCVITIMHLFAFFLCRLGNATLPAALNASPSTGGRICGFPYVP